MTKADLVEAVCAGASLGRKESQDLVEALLAAMKQSLVRGEALRLSGFGTFSVRAKAPRVGRDPRSGAAMTLDGRRVVTFKLSKVLKEAINREARKDVR